MTRSVLLAAAVVGCATPHTESVVDERGRDQAVRAAALEHLVLERHAPGDRATCLAVPGVGQQEALSLARAAAPERVMHPGDDCRLDPPGTGVIRHLPSGHEAVLYEVYVPEWMSENEARVRAAWYVASLYGESCGYRVKLAEGRWRVVAVEECIAS